MPKDIMTTLNDDEWALVRSYLDRTGTSQYALLKVAVLEYVTTKETNEIIGSPGLVRGHCPVTGGSFPDEDFHQNPSHLRAYPQCRIPAYRPRMRKIATIRPPKRIPMRGK